MNNRTYHTDGTPAPVGHIFVFGSNLSGIHGAGAARAALKFYGAVWGQAEGRAGNSYAIPTVKHHIAGPLTLEEIKLAVDRFIQFASYAENITDQFFITRVGCGLAGHNDEDIAAMFKDAPLNCSLPVDWQYLIED